MVRRVLGAGALVLGALAAIAGRPSPDAAQLDVASLAGEIDREADHVTAIELAEWIRDRRAGLRVLDVRSSDEYDAYHIPSAEHVPLDSIVRLRPAGDETLVLYSEGGAHAAQAWVLLRAIGYRRVYFLRGGLLDWTEDVMNPVLGADPSPGSGQAARVSALSRYFGGTPRVSGTSEPSPARTATAAVARMRRRGC